MTDSRSSLGHPQGHYDATLGWVRNTIPKQVLPGVAIQTAEAIDIRLAIGFALADAAELYTIPANIRLLVLAAWWEIVTGFSGGSSSAIGLSASVAPHTTKGDLLGGAGGDVAATLVAGNTQGTIGVDFSAAPKLCVLEPLTVIRFDRITSAFTAGAGYAHISALSISV